MRDIQMVDLKNQYQAIKPEIDKAIIDVIESSAFINGPDVKHFQTELADYLQCKHVIACGNGTDALQIALMALDLKPGDEVITPNFTFIATVEAIALLGLKPVLIDVDRNTFNLNPDEIEKAITIHTKAIIPVHLFGQCADMTNILAIAKKHNLKIIEDTAQSLGADYAINNRPYKAGTIGDIGCTSFFPSKNLGTYGDGGALFTNNDELAEKIRCIINHGSKVKYYHDYIGINSRLDTLHAAILRVKLQHLNEYNSKRQQAAAFYNQHLQHCRFIELPTLAPNSTHIYHQYTLKLKNINRQDFQKYLADKGIPTMVYYPLPFHFQKAYQYLQYKKGDFPITEALCECVLSLPMHTELDNEQLQYITQAINNYQS